MKFLSILFLATIALAEIERNCYEEISKACHSKDSFALRNPNSKCNSLYLSFKKKEILNSLEQYASKYLTYSYDNLLTAANFGSYFTNRKGFQKYFQNLSDDAWKRTIDIIKYVNKRGGNFTYTVNREQLNQESHEIFELGSMAKALDMTKDLANAANHIHHNVQRTSEYDAEVSSFIEDNFVYKQSSLIRELSGYTNDLIKMCGSENDVSLSLYLFDEYLKEYIVAI